MVQLNETKKAALLKEDGGNLAGGFEVTSSDPSIVKIQSYALAPHVVGMAPGTATVTATRTLDGEIATLEVEVVAAIPFVLNLGPETPA